MERARQLIEEAGVAGVTTELTYNSSVPVHEEIAILLQTAYREVGVNLELSKVPDAVFFERIFSVQTPMVIWRDAAFTPDPGFDLSLWYPSKSGSSVAQLEVSSNNEDRTNQARIDELVQNGITTIDEGERNMIWEEIQLLVETTQQMGRLPIPAYSVAHRDSVVGMTYYPDNTYKVFDLDKLA
jgi:peptide/nickel transport system substrate-binding protein